MKKVITYFISIMIFLLFSVSSWAASELSRQFIEERLVEKGLDKAQVQSMIYDPRISLRPDIVIQNLFYSSPKGTEEEPTIMNIDPQRIKDGRAFIKEHVDKLEREGVILGLSGGVDSAVAAALCQRAVGAKNTLALMMPDKDSQREHVNDAVSFAKELGIANY